MNEQIVISAVLSLVGLSLWVYLFFKYKPFRPSIVAMILYELHTLVFFVAYLLFFDKGAVLFWNSWSSIIRIQALLYLIGGAAILMYELRKIERLK